MTRAQHVHNEQDLVDVASWLKCAPDDLELVVTLESIAPFLSQVGEMERSLPKFPEEAARIEVIEELLRAGEPTRPIYVEAGDPTHFVMEGRHRLVAFHSFLFVGSGLLLLWIIVNWAFLATNFFVVKPTPLLHASYPEVFIICMLCEILWMARMHWGSVLIPVVPLVWAWHLGLLSR